MSDKDKVFTGAIPALYDRYLGPFLFAPYAADLASRAARLGPSAVLETAAGTGIVTRVLRSALPATTMIVATDLNQAMLDHAAAQSPGGNIEWRQADATALPFADGSFDAVICQFGVMFFPDKAQGFREARRVLRPGGTFLFNVWDRIAVNEASAILTAAVAELFPRDPPQFLARTPHGYHDTAAIRSSLEEVGFRDIVIETVALRGRADSPRDFAIGLCQGSPLRNEIAERGGSLDEAVERASAALAARFGTGPIDTPMQAHVVTAWR
jgi:ubiquinone/menaquinone biosynthesis C-methylase UbiE